jgi:carbon-monoxide dehydrogenase small subunit
VAGIVGGERKRLGPAGSGNAGAAAPADLDRRVEKTPAPAPKPAASRPNEAPSKVMDDFKPQASLSQSFTVSHSADEVWAFFGRIEEVAACLPGAALTSVSDDGHVEGGIRVKVGPISAAFQGVADVTRDEGSRSGVISGSGRDQKSNSATRGVIRYTVREAEGGGAKVEVDVGYTLTGMLAQFGRSGLVQDVANRLTAAFVQNLEARMSHSAGGGAPPPAAASELDAGSLVFAVVGGWFRALLARLRGRN